MGKGNIWKKENREGKSGGILEVRKSRENSETTECRGTRESRYKRDYE